MLRKHAAILTGKLISQTTSTFNLGGGSAAPGLYALKIEPKLLEQLHTIAEKSVIITGTNGKTTTSRMLAHMAETQGLRVVRNATGSNLERGIASALVRHSHKKFDLAIWEVDEAAFNTVAPKLQPDMVVFLNVFRDQLDRYGEIDTVVQRWVQTMPQLKDTQVILNGDDPNLYDLAQNGVKAFGIKGEIIEFEKKHEGGKMALDTVVTDIKSRGLEGLDFKLTSDKTYDIHLPIPGKYHIYDFAAAFSVAQQLGLSSEKAIASLETFSPAFGRVERVELPGKREAYIFLIKNPYGANQVLETLAPLIKPDDRLMGVLNDNFADGTDVSWIWDTNWEQLSKTPYHMCVLSGTRAYDLALRLKYADFAPTEVVPELENAFKEATKGLEGRLFILPTYTALLSLQKLLAAQGIKKEYWNEK